MTLSVSYLVFPKNSPLWRITGLGPDRAVERRIPLLFLPALDDKGEEALIFRSGRVLTGDEFRILRQTSYAWVETGEPCRVTRALDLPSGERGVQPLPLNRHSDR